MFQKRNYIKCFQNQISVFTFDIPFSQITLKSFSSLSSKFQRRRKSITIVIVIVIVIVNGGHDGVILFAGSPPVLAAKKVKHEMELFGDVRIDNYYWRRRFLGTHWWASKAGPWPPPHCRRRPCWSWTDWCRSNAPETRRRLMPRWCWPKLPCRWGNRLPEGQGGGAGAVQGGAEGQGGGGQGLKYR